MSRIVLPLAIPPLLADVGAPSVAPQGTSGATSYGYSIVAVDANGKKTAVSSEGTTASGNATLDGTNFNRITWTDVTGGVSYEIHRTTSAGTPGTTGLIGTVDAGVQQFDDTGLAVSDASAPNATNTTGDGEPISLTSYNGDVEVAVEDVGTATYQLQGAYGDAWQDEGTTITADAVRQITAKYGRVRAKCSAYTSGTPKAFLAGDTY